MIYFVIGVLVFFVLLGLLKFVTVPALMDRSVTHKFQANSVPLYGGLVFVSLFLIGSFLFKFDFQLPYWFFVGALIYFFIGVVDDMYGLKWWLKLLPQALVMIYLMQSFYGSVIQLSFIELSPLLSILFFGGWFLGISNAVNLLDGVDGLAGSVMCILLLALAGIGYLHSITAFFWINIFLMVCILPFLWFNFYPAKLYMGDSGSLFLGYYLAVVPFLFHSFVQDVSVSFLPFVILCLYLVIDTLRVMFGRLCRGHHPFVADHTHGHHLMLRLFKTPIKVVACICLFNGLCSVAVVLFGF